MSELSARSDKDPTVGWRHPLPVGPVALAGGTPTADQLRAAGFPSDAACWPVGWDPYISTPHALLDWDGTRLRVRRRLKPKATTNPVVVDGQPTDEFDLAPGRSFRIADTVFTLLAERTAVSELSLSRHELRAAEYPDPGRRLEALAGLPAAVRAADTDEALAGAVADVLLSGVPGATFVAVVRLTAEAVIVAAARGRDDGPPSARLVRAAVAEQRQTVLHVWSDAPATADDPTRAAGADWAACVPLHDDQHPDWGIYLIGRLTRRTLDPTAAVRPDLKFAELAADLFAALRSVGVLQRRSALLARFLSPAVQAVVTADRMDDRLAPRTTAVTVLFCDLRGSSRVADEADDPAAAWSSVSAALEMMSDAILDLDGVIGDFQGDAAVGFWGWPVADDPSRDPQLVRACRAALAIRKKFQRAAADGRLNGFTCGVGLAHGPAVAGRIGVPEQYKVGVFGRPVNLAARLEGLTKRFGVPIVLDETTAACVGPGCEWGRVRRLARVLPAGMTRPVTAFELLPPATDPAALSEVHRLDYHAALEHFTRGRWAEARTKLAPLLRTDGPSRFLAGVMDAVPTGPPAEWDGLIRLDGK